MKEIRTTHVLMVSLENWAKKGVYKELYKLLSKKSLGVIRASFAEMFSLTPMAYTSWWSLQHNRFIRSGVTQREFIVMHEIMNNFLNSYASGELNRGKKESKESQSQAEDAGRI